MARYRALCLVVRLNSINAFDRLLIWTLRVNVEQMKVQQCIQGDVRNLEYVQVVLA